uniref:Uncharacterized protein n=1 Tax=Daucus carota subsp. sativus TaxID=79200 RepID=A0A175YFK8_DAUCS
MLSLLIIPISLSLFLILRKPNAEGSNLNVPPGSSGWPLVGESIKFALAGPQEFIKERTKKYSPDVFQTSLLGEKMAVFCGAQGNKFLFTNESKLLTSWWPQSMKKALLFPEFVEASLKEVSALKRSFMHDILKPEALKQYIPVMDSMAREHVDSEWAGNEVVKVFPMSKKYTFDLACRLFMSIVDAEHVTRLARHFTLVTSGMFSVPIDLPGTAYNGAIKGGRTEVFNSTLYGEWLSGAEGNKLVFTNERRLVRSWWPLSVRKALYSSEFLDDSTDEIAAVLLTFIHDTLKPEVIKKCMPVMDSIAQELVMSKCAAKEVEEVLPESKIIHTFNLGCTFLMNVVPEKLIEITTERRKAMLMENNEKSVIVQDLLSRLLGR